MRNPTARYEAFAHELILNRCCVGFAWGTSILVLSFGVRYTFRIPSSSHSGGTAFFIHNLWPSTNLATTKVWKMQPCVFLRRHDSFISLQSALIVRRRSSCLQREYIRQLGKGMGCAHGVTDRETYEHSPDARSSTRANVSKT